MRSLEPLGRLVTALARLPGVGRRSAERMALGLLQDPEGLLKDVLSALQEAGTRLKPCSRCGNLTLRTEDPCSLCTDPRRDAHLLCVVETPGDILTIERAGGFSGRYHALMGRLSPMKGSGVGDLHVDSLLARLAAEEIREVILALNPDVEGDATASFLHEALRARGVRVTRPARGIPAGSGLVYADAATLAKALADRQPM